MYKQISNPMDYKAALYIRLSKEDDSNVESESVKNQRSLLSQFAREQRLDIYDIYIDDGFSGTNFDRPAFKRLIYDIENKKVNLVLTKDMSRLGRDYIQTGFYVEKYFPMNGVRYLAINDSVDTGIESSSNDITPFKAIMNDMYAKDISKKITSVKRDKQRKGLFIGGKAAYGYKKSEDNKNYIEIDVPAANIVRKIFALAIEGKSCREIAVQLNNENVPTPATYAGLNIAKEGIYSGKWSSERIAFMLKNEVYIGNMVQGRTRQINYKIKKCKKLSSDEWTIVENTHEPIIDKETFEKVQILIESRKSTRSRTHDFLLKGLIFCHECGYPLGVLERTLAGDKKVLYFVCRTYQRFTKERKCTCHCIRVDTITEAVLEKIKSICTDYLDHKDCEEKVQKAENLALENDNPKAEIITLKQQITKLTANLDNAYDDKLSGKLEDSDFQRIYDKIKNERNQLKEQLIRLEKQAENPTSQKLNVKQVVKDFNRKR